MQNKQFILLVVLSLGFVTISFGQHQRYNIKNGIGIMGGLSQYDIQTDNFTTKSGNGFIGGLVATVELPHKWYTVSYGLQLSDNSIEIEGRPNLLATNYEMIEYKVMAVQLSFLLHAKIISDNLTIDLGPQLQYNGKLDLKDSNQEGFLINGYDALLAKDISDISQFNINGLAGASLGMGNFRLRASYIYGFTNILNKLNDQDITTTPGSKKFEGHQNMLVFGLMITF